MYRKLLIYIDKISIINNYKFNLTSYDFLVFLHFDKNLKEIHYE